MPVKGLRKVIYSSPFIPAEWIAAHGLTPCRRSFGSTLPDPLVISPEAGHGPLVISPEAGVCPYMRGFINEAAQDPQALAVILTTTCDQMRRGADLLRLRSEVPHFLMNIPSCSGNRNAENLYLRELERLGSFLVSLGGTQPGPGKLVDVMLEYEIARLSGQSSDFVPVPGEFFGGPRNRVPVGFIGGPLAEGHYGVFDILADQGADVIFNGTESGERVLPGRFDYRRINRQPLNVLAEAYFGAIPDVSERPNKRIFAWMERAVEAGKVRGIVFIRYAWCDKWHAEVHRFREALAIPLLDLELDAGPVNERTVNRIGAFMEGLK